MPIPFVGPASSGVHAAAVADLALDTWITIPFVSSSVHWSRVTRETESYVLHYYSMRRAPPTYNGVPRYEFIGDVLLLQLDNGNVVDADSDDIRQVLRDIKSFF